MSSSAFSISDEAKRKLQVYTASHYLFEKGKSHPQIIEMLAKFEPDKNLLVSIVDKAMREEWDKLFQDSRKFFGDGKTFAEVLSYLEEREPDKEIALWICNEWYEWTTRYMEMIVESPTNVFEGSKWSIISAIVIPVLFWIHASRLTKIIWIIFFLSAFLLWLMGIKQRQVAKKIDVLFARDDKIGAQEVTNK